MRLNRFLSVCGMGSRRGCEQIILDGRVMINNKRVTELGTQVQEGDTVTVDGKPLRQLDQVVIVLNKPRGYICTRSDTHDRSTIYDLLPAKFQHLHHVGRLDQDSEGLILLTNRGDLSQRLTHPSEGVEKEYEVRTERPVDQNFVFKLVEGMETPEGFARAERAWLENPYLVHVVLKQGLKRQIRIMFFQLGNEVERLVRIRIGGVRLHGIGKGNWKQLTDAEIARFLQTGKSSRSSREAVTITQRDDDDDHFKPLKPAEKAEREKPQRSRQPRRKFVAKVSNPKPYIPKEVMDQSRLAKPATEKAVPYAKPAKTKASGAGGFKRRTDTNKSKKPLGNKGNVRRSRSGKTGR
ncbi:MAG: rRNA pseudouridine synthase [Verrucomicrobiaceae bacterium]|nr:rRNA pseudouridine synthase [Verrucomicrobiaceae bacterium]